MASSSQVESIFFDALEKKAGDERSAYLDRACGGDSALRLRVEKLLESHPLAMDFLAQPAVDRRKFNTHLAADEFTSDGPTSGAATKSTRSRARKRDGRDAERRAPRKCRAHPEPSGPVGQTRLARPDRALRGAGSPRQGRVRHRVPGVRRDAAARRRDQGDGPASWPPPPRPASGSCARPGRPRPSGTRTWSPSTRSRSSRCPTW